MHVFSHVYEVIKYNLTFMFISEEIAEIPSTKKDPAEQADSMDIASVSCR